jgi:transcriptional regulator with XRE-family HTH domain
VHRSQGAVGLAYQRIVNDIRNTGLTAAELATIVGVRERQVQHWASGGHKPQGEARDRLLEVAYVVDQLKEVYLAEGVEIWLHGRNRELEGERPIDLLRNGHFKPVLAAIERLKVGAM